jgi:hypothetical protein
MNGAEWLDLHGPQGDNDRELEEAADALTCVPCPECGGLLEAFRWHGDILMRCTDCGAEDAWDGRRWPWIVECAAKMREAQE